MTQVEQAKAKRNAHTVALRKPPLEELRRINTKMAEELSYPEITYPLSAGLPVLNDSPQTLASNRAPQPPKLAKLPGTIKPSGTSPGQGTRENAATSMINGNPLLPWDAMPSKTFAVLKMNMDENPWDLGSLLLNWESIMGTTIVDWLLPIKRSPCCAHDDPESHFSVGPAVDRLRAGYYFIESKAVRTKGRRKHSSKRINSDAKEGASRSPRRVKKPAEDGSSRLNNPTELRDINR